MFCANCRTELPKEANFCWNCGISVRQKIETHPLKKEFCEIRESYQEKKGDGFRGITRWEAILIESNEIISTTPWLEIPHWKSGLIFSESDDSYNKRSNIYYKTSERQYR